MPADTVQQIMEQAIQHWNAGQLTEAESAAKRVLQSAPDHLDAMRMAGLCALQREDATAAASFFERLARLQPTELVHHINLGEVYRRLSRPHDAIESLRRAIALAPNLPELHNNLGLILEMTGQRGEASEHYRKAIALKPDYGAAHVNLASALLGTKRSQEALAAARRAVDLMPQLASAHLYLGMAHKELG